MFDFNTKTTAAGVLTGAAALGAAGTCSAGVLIDLPDGSDTSSVSGVAAIYEFEFTPIADATEVFIKSDTGESSMFVRTVIDEFSSGEADWGVFLKLDGDWELMGFVGTGFQDGPAAITDNLNFIIDSGNPITFAQAALSGIRVAIIPDLTSGTGSVEVAVVNSPLGKQQLDVTVVPEPASLALLGLGGLFLSRRRH